MAKQFNEKHKVRAIDTHNVCVNLPMNTKYLTGNPISRWLIMRFINAIMSMLLDVDKHFERILDVGCGEGIIPRQLKLLWPSASFCGMDINLELLMVGRKLIPDMDCVQGSIYDLPWKNGAYDLVCCTEVLEHLEFPELALPEIRRVGNQFFLFSVPNEPWWCIANMARGAYFSTLGNPPGHVNHWRASRFIRLLSQFFEVKNVRCPFPWIIVLCRKK